MANYTQELIYTTFSNMLDRMPFDKITVTALITEANISRNTFYYHYEDIYALLDEVLARLVIKYDQDTKFETLPNVLKTFLYDCRENKKKVYNIFNSISRDRLERYIFEGANSMIYFHVLKLAESRGVDDDRADNVADLVRYSIYGFFMEFLWDGMRGDIDERVDKLCTIYTELLDCML